MFCLRVIMFLHVNEIYFTVEEVDFCGYSRSVTRHLTEGVVIVFSCDEDYFFFHD